MVRLNIYTKINTGLHKNERLSLYENQKGIIVVEGMKGN